MLHIVTLERLDILPEDGPTGTETCRRFYGIFNILMCVWICFRILSLKTKDTSASSWLFDFVTSLSLKPNSTPITQLSILCNYCHHRRSFFSLKNQNLEISILTFWSRNYFLILADPVYKMWIMQEQNKLELWNKLHFEENKTESIYLIYNIQYFYLLNKYIKYNFGG